MKLTDLKNMINREIAWICISASSAAAGGITLQIEQTEKGLDVTLSKSGEGTGFESSEETCTDITLDSVTERIMKINAVSLVEEGENCYSFDDDADIAGMEYEITFGIDEYILVSITGCDFQSKSVNTFMKVIASIFPEAKEILDFLGGEH